MYDVAIIGAEPAGATPARHPGKCCGGLPAPDTQKMLARMGMALPRSVPVGPQIFVLRSMDLDSGPERFYQRFYIRKT